MAKIDAIETVPGSELIQDTFLFKFFNFDETMAMSALCRREERKQGELIIEEDELGQALYLVVGGHVRVYKGEGETEQTLARLGRGELFGEMSLIEGNRTSARVKAYNEVDCLLITKEDLFNLMGKDVQISARVYKNFTRMLSERLRITSEELSTWKASM